VVAANAKSPHQKPDLSAIRGELERVGANATVVELVMNLLEQMATQNNQLQWRLQTALRQLYRTKSEKISPEQLALFLSKLTEDQASLADVEGADGDASGAEASTPSEPIKTKPKTPHKKPFPDHLRREVREVPVPEADRPCAQCGTEKQPMGHDARTVWEFRPAEFFIVEERLEKRVCKRCQEGVVTAEASPKPVEGGRPGPGLLAQIVTSKMRDACPLYRQSQIYVRSGVHLSPSTLGDWSAATADMLEPIYKRLRVRTLACYLLSLDDTGLPVLDREHANGIKKGHLWTYLGDGGCVGFCEYTANWKQEAPCAVIAEFKGAVVQGDGYAGIDAAFRKNAALVRAGCMDHCRRRFVFAMQDGAAHASSANSTPWRPTPAETAPTSTNSFVEDAS
jgi:transposase